MSSKETVNRIISAYQKLYGTPPRVFGSPGRINLIGEHTDYNEGLVLPASVGQAVYFAIGPRTDNVIELHAADLGDSYRVVTENLTKPEKVWPRYQLGILDQLRKHNIPFGGFQAVFGGDIPSGAGMSSSAALECALLFGLNEIFSLGLSRMDIVRLAQKAENEYVGVDCGIMDQFASVFGKAGQVIQLDCRSMDFQYYPFNLPGYHLVLCDTTVKHSLASTEYNTRRKECEQGVTSLRNFFPEIKSLRDVSQDQVESYRAFLGDTIYRRCHFVTGENERVRAVCRLLVENNVAAIGEKMYETHDGLQKDYDVSCDELNFLVDETRPITYVAGARMMGGGFGGCTINLVRSDFLDIFEIRVKAAYQDTFGKELPCYRVEISEGTSEVTASFSQRYR